MAGRDLDPSAFRALLTERFVFTPIDLGLIDVDGVHESLPGLTLLRPSDLLRLRFSFVGLVLDGDTLRRSDDAAEGFLRVIFGGQHLHERAFFEQITGMGVGDFTPSPGQPTDPDTESAADAVLPPPVQIRLAGASRLVFRISDERIPYTAAGLLEALRTLPLAVAPHAVQQATLWRPLEVTRVSASTAAGLRSAARMRASAAVLEARFGARSAARALIAASAGAGAFRLAAESRRELIDVVTRVPGPVVLPPVPRAPSPTETAIELPWRLQLSPHRGAAFAHRSAAPPEGRVELWHTRLGNRSDDPVDRGEGEGGGVDESARDDRTVRAVCARDFDETPGFGFDATATAVLPEADQTQDRPNWRSPLSSRDRMMLVHESANFHLRRDRLRYTPPSVAVDRLMLSSLGGWLSSRFETEPPDGALSLQEWTHNAALGRDSSVKVVYAGFLWPLLHPASLVKVTERKVRDGVASLFQRMYVVVREPERSYGATGETAGDVRIDLGMMLTSVRILTVSTPDLDLPVDHSPGIGGVLFTPTVNGVPFRFRMLGVDLDGHLLEFDGPLVFAEYDHNAYSAADPLGSPLTKTIAFYAPIAPSFDFRGQKVAYAASANADDTSLATRSMTFDVIATTGTLARPQSQARVEPILREARTIVPAMSALAGANASVAVRFPAEYLSKGFAGNAAEVFLQLAAPAALNFSTQSDRSGGFVAPSLDVSALSRSLGPVGGPVADLVAGGPAFDIAKYFPSSAKLFGLVSLAELIPSDLDTLPRFVAQGLDAAGMLTANLAQLQQTAVWLAAQPSAVAARLQETATAAEALLAAVTGLADDGVPIDDRIAAVEAAVPGLRGALGALSTELAAADALLRADREALTATAQRLLDQLGATAAETQALLAALRLLASGGTLPETVRARLDWSTPLRPWPAGDPIFAPRDGTGSLTLAVDLQAPTRPGGEASALVTCAISPFELRLIGGADPFITLSFEKIEFSAVPGSKTDVNVVFTADRGVRFGGPLSFVETLREIIPFDGFSDPPYLDVSASGIKAGFDLAIPTVAMGVFSLSNIVFSAAFEVPFVGESIAVRFAFSSREDPFRLAVAFFAGGGFFAVVITPNEVRELEAAFEFGAAIELNFGVASGSVSVMAGIYFRLRTENGVTSALLAGYFRARGEVDVLGLITASIEIYLELSYETSTGKAVGRASISVEVSVCLLSFSVSISCEKKFAGSSGDPTFAEVMGVHPAAPAEPRPWDDYCDAFAD
ncbi:hypothetical protein HQQ81_04520 [Microbacteriaceae bacterium VKM Ac-2854]|nr:hypothetical protein [Microbacteriaceae bacterium VKM Ac-2854]